MTTRQAMANAKVEASKKSFQVQQDPVAKNMTLFSRYLDDANLQPIPRSMLSGTPY